jgi:hypothetical protein
MQRASGLITRLGLVVAATAAIVLGVAFSGCDTAPENANQVTEGQGMKLGDLLYNVQITRILNPADREDSAYLVGQKAPAPDQYYLAVFMRIDNEGSESADVASDLNIVDTVGDTFDPIPSDSLFALKLGATVGPGDQLPEDETTAANGPIQGAMVLFRIDGSAIQDRPLTLEIHSPDGDTGEVELDI